MVLCEVWVLYSHSSHLHTSCRWFYVRCDSCTMINTHPICTLPADGSVWGVILVLWLILIPSVHPLKIVLYEVWFLYSHSSLLYTSCRWFCVRCGSCTHTHPICTPPEDSSVWGVIPILTLYSHSSHLYTSCRWFCVRCDSCTHTHLMCTPPVDGSVWGVIPVIISSLLYTPCRWLCVRYDSCTHTHPICTLQVRHG